jgi:hypothetical protein
LVGNGTGAILDPTNLHWDNVNTRPDRKRRADGAVGDERHGV